MTTQTSRTAVNERSALSMSRFIQVVRCSILKMRFILVLIFSHAVLLTSAQQDSLFYRASQHQELNEYEKAIELYSELIDQGTDVGEVYLNRGNCRYALKEYLGAIDDFLFLHIQFPNDTLTNYCLGMVYFDMKKWPLATIYLQKSLDHRLQPQYNDYVYLGSAYSFIPNNERAIPLLAKAAELDPKNENVLNNLAWAYIGTEPKKSCDLFTKAFELDSINDVNINNLGYSHLMCGNTEDAEYYLTMALEVNPDNLFVHRNLGLLWVEKGDLLKACEYLEYILEKGIDEKWGSQYTVELKKQCGN